MASLVKSGKYGTINTAETSTDGYYVINFISEAYTLQNNATIDGKIITAGESFVKAKYLSSVQDITNWYWEHHPKQQAIIVPTRTIIHTRLDVFGIKDVQDIPKVCVTGFKQKKPYKDILFV